MIAYRPIAPLALGRSGLMPAVAAIAVTALFGTTWQGWNEPGTVPEKGAERAEDATPGPAIRKRP
jgi:hypothetical protein